MLKGIASCTFVTAFYTWIFAIAMYIAMEGKINVIILAAYTVILATGMSVLYAEAYSEGKKSVLKTKKSKRKKVKVKSSEVKPGDFFDEIEISAEEFKENETEMAN